MNYQWNKYGIGIAVNEVSDYFTRLPSGFKNDINLSRDLLFCNIRSNQQLKSDIMREEKNMILPMPLSSTKLLN